MKAFTINVSIRITPHEDDDRDKEEIDDAVVDALSDEAVLLTADVELLQVKKERS